MASLLSSLVPILLHVVSVSLSLMKSLISFLLGGIKDDPKTQAVITSGHVKGKSETRLSVKSRMDTPSSFSTHEMEQMPSSEADNIYGQLKWLNPKNLKTIKDITLRKLSSELTNDKTYLMERIIQLAADLPVGSEKSQKLTTAFISQLWADLDHPPKSYLGNDFVYRKADGSNNNMLWPHIGAAGQPYARTVKPKKMQPISLPDPGLVFDSVLARKTFEPHPNKISSVLFYLASIIIHDAFHTSHENFATNKTSSYLDLSPLYGNNVEEQHNVRTLENGRLRPDCFSDHRILSFPPGVGALLIMFNRFHNHVVENLAKVDENGRFSKILHPIGKPTPHDAQKLYDEALFQTGRLVTTGLYINIILKDYVRTILNLNRVDTTWNLDPRSEEGQAVFPENVPQAMGYQASAEFNLVYRWHSCLSRSDEQWTKKEYERLTGKNADVTMHKLIAALQAWAARLPADPQQRPFADLQRKPNGKFDDNDLAAIWTASVEQVAGRFGANHVPEILKSVEVLGIIQSRSWNLASLNEFREYFHLRPHGTFEDINPDPSVAAQLKHLYGHPDNVEIYPGIICEETKVPVIPGSGLCTNFSISRAILSDAVALVRSDRYYTLDYMPKNLTNWGFHAADYDLDINYGCIFYKLVLTALPNNYSQNSVYAHYPQVIPAENLKILQSLKQDAYYDFASPAARPSPVVLSSAHSIEAVMTDLTSFKSLWSENIPQLHGKSGATTKPLQQKNMWSVSVDELQGNTMLPPERDDCLASAIAQHPDVQRSAQQFFLKAFTQRLQNASKHVGNVFQVDIIQDVLQPSIVDFVTSILPLPTTPSTGTTSGTHKLLELLFCSQYSSQTPHHQSQDFRHDLKKLAGEMTTSVTKITGWRLEKGNELRSCCKEAVETFLATTLSIENMVWSEILPLAATLYTILMRICAQSIDHYLDIEVDGLLHIQRVARSDTSESWRALSHYAAEAIRSSSSVSIARVATMKTSLEYRNSKIDIVPGQTVICHLEKTFTKKLVNGEAEAFRLEQDGLSAFTKGFGPELRFAYDMSKIATTALMKSLGEVGNIKRSPGPQGQLRSVKDNSGATMFLNEKESLYSHCPGSMKLCWDAC